ncbi:MAG: hypothetical protein NTX88_10030 [Candidatus Atribacteria bacterium]|nr:hypothetical protein [Candidatus Atribacteria bacterium]
MEPTEKIEKGNTLSLNDPIMKNLAKNWTAFNKDVQKLDIQGMEKSITNLETGMDQVKRNWDDYHELFLQKKTSSEEYVHSQEYINELEESLKQTGIPFSGTFPQYTMVPFQLSISLDRLEIEMSIGRKKEKTTILRPEELARWVLTQFKKVTGKKFDDVSFMRDLIAAYSIMNKISFRKPSVDWGKAVSLKEMYDVRQWWKQGKNPGR